MNNIICWWVTFLFLERAWLIKPQELIRSRISKRPFQVALLLNYPQNTTYRCAGVILKPKVILTAAHCTYYAATASPLIANQTISPENLTVLVGANYLDDHRGIMREVLDIKAHYYYNNAEGYHHDIAVIFLKDPIEFTYRTQKVSLSYFDYSEVSKIGVASGWVYLTGQRSMELREIEVETNDYKSCKMFEVPDFKEDMICLKRMKKYDLLNDGGGPLTIDGELVGLASFVKSISFNQDLLVVFTKVVSHHRFIREALSYVT